MKKIIYTLLLIFPLWGLGGCSDDDNNCQGVDCLPPVTQTGAGTFGCLVNGEPFVDNSGSFNCFYQLVDGEYFFSISAENEGITPRNIRLSTNDLQIEQDETYQLYEPLNGNAYASVIFNFNGTQPNINSTSQQFSGTLGIAKLNFDNNIVSGTFNFQVRDTINNITYIITKGRFDAQFTQ